MAVLANMTSLVDDPLASVMRKHGADVTREDYIDMAWGNDVPEPWTLEHELELPDELQDFSKVVPDRRAEEEPEPDEPEADADAEDVDKRWTVPRFKPPRLTRPTK